MTARAKPKPPTRRYDSGAPRPTAWLGIDPGLDGAVAVVDDFGTVWSAIAPTKPTGKGTGRDFDLAGMIQVLCGNHASHVVLAAIEEVNAAPMRGRRQGTTSMFNFGRGYGMWTGLLGASAIEFITVPPKKWKAAILRGFGTDKTAAITYVKQFHPSVNLRATPRCRTDHDGIADAVCLADYARREWKTKQLLEVNS